MVEYLFNGSTVELVPAWTGRFSAPEAQLLLALAAAKVAAGELTPPPVVPSAPAIAFTAAAPGPGGNGITVSVTPDPGPLVTTKLLINAKEVDTYAGLADATAAAMRIGVDVASNTPGSPPAGTGLVTVQAGSATGTGLPKDGQTLTVKASPATSVVAPDGTTMLFKLVARAGYTGPGPSGAVPPPITHLQSISLGGPTGDGFVLDPSSTGYNFVGTIHVDQSLVPRLAAT
jgi:hypothetical protein